MYFFLIESWNIMLKFGTFSVGGWWGQLMLFFKKNVVVPKNSISHHSRTIFKPEYMNIITNSFSCVSRNSSVQSVSLIFFDEAKWNMNVVAKWNNNEVIISAWKCQVAVRTLGDTGFFRLQGIKVLWRLLFLGYLRTLSLKFQKDRTKIEVVLSLPCWLSQFSFN